MYYLIIIIISLLFIRSAYKQGWVHGYKIRRQDNKLDGWSKRGMIKSTSNKQKCTRQRPSAF